VNIRNSAGYAKLQYVRSSIC